MRPVAFDLLVGGNGAEDDFGELATVEWTICDAPMTELAVEEGGWAHNKKEEDIPNDLKRFLHNRHREMSPIINQSSDIVFRHLRQLLLKDTFEARQDYQTFPFTIVIDDSEFDFSISFLRDRRLARAQIY